MSWADALPASLTKLVLLRDREHVRPLARLRVLFKRFLDSRLPALTALRHLAIRDAVWLQVRANSDIHHITVLFWHLRQDCPFLPQVLLRVMNRLLHASNDLVLVTLGTASPAAASAGDCCRGRRAAAPAQHAPGEAVAATLLRLLCWAAGTRTCGQVRRLPVGFCVVKCYQ